MFPDFKNSSPKKSFWHFNLYFVLKNIYLRLLRRNNKLKINNFLTNIWRNNWRFNIWHRKRTPLKHLKWIVDEKWKLLLFSILGTHLWIGGHCSSDKTIWICEIHSWKSLWLSAWKTNSKPCTWYYTVANFSSKCLVG